MSIIEGISLSSIYDPVTTDPLNIEQLPGSRIANRHPGALQSQVRPGCPSVLHCSIEQAAGGETEAVL